MKEQDLPLVGVAEETRINGLNDARGWELTDHLAVVDLDYAMGWRWDSDAHFTTYAVLGQDSWPRLNKSALPTLHAAGREVVVVALAFDFDNPGHAPWTPELREGFDGRVAPLTGRLADWAYLYTTAHGARIVYVLDKPLQPEAMEDVYKVMLEEFKAAGLPMDPACAQWNRMFRSPRVLRDGQRTEDQDYFDIVERPEVRLCVEAHARPLLPATLAVSGVAEGGRNNYLYKLACELKDLGQSREHVEAVVLHFAANGCSPPLPEAEVLSVVTSAFRRAGGPKSPAGDLALALRATGAELFHDPDLNPYVTLASGETYPLRSRFVRTRTARLGQKPPSKHALEAALDMLEGVAIHEGPEHEVHVRTARIGDCVYLDLGRDVVRITASGWSLEKQCAVKFLRPNGLRRLPQPVRTGEGVKALRPLINVSDERSWKPLIGWLVGALAGEGPYLILIVQGEQGSGKSTAVEIVRRIIDPNKANLRALPRKERDLLIAAKNSLVLAFDNLSGIQPYMADALCRLATGSGFSTRKNYADDVEIIFAASRPLVINGIEDLATRGDLADRAVVLYLPAIPPEDRRPERELWKRFEVALPTILGGLLDAVAGALSRLDSVNLSQTPRMADAAIWVTAAEEALGWASGSFVKLLVANRDEALDQSLEAMPLATTLRRFMSQRSQWQGTASELLEQPGFKGLDLSASQLGSQLRRLAPALRARGLAIETGRGHGGRFIYLRSVTPSPEAGPSSP